MTYKDLNITGNSIYEYASNLKQLIHSRKNKFLEAFTTKSEQLYSYFAFANPDNGAELFFADPRDVTNAIDNDLDSIIIRVYNKNNDELASKEVSTDIAVAKLTENVNTLSAIEYLLDSVKANTDAQAFKDKMSVYLQNMRDLDDETASLIEEFSSTINNDDDTVAILSKITSLLYTTSPSNDANNATSADGFVARALVPNTDYPSVCPILAIIGWSAAWSYTTITNVIQAAYSFGRVVFQGIYYVLNASISLIARLWRAFDSAFLNPSVITKTSDKMAVSSVLYDIPYAFRIKYTDFQNLWAASHGSLQPGDFKRITLPGGYIYIYYDAPTSYIYMCYQIILQGHTSGYRRSNGIVYTYPVSVNEYADVLTKCVSNQFDNSCITYGPGADSYEQVQGNAAVNAAVHSGGLLLWNSIIHTIYSSACFSHLNFSDEQRIQATLPYETTPASYHISGLINGNLPENGATPKDLHDIMDISTTFESIPNKLQVTHESDGFITYSELQEWDQTIDLVDLLVTKNPSYIPLILYGFAMSVVSNRIDFVPQENVSGLSSGMYTIANSKEFYAGAVKFSKVVLGVAVASVGLSAGLKIRRTLRNNLFASYGNLTTAMSSGDKQAINKAVKKYNRNNTLAKLTGTKLPSNVVNTLQGSIPLGNWTDTKIQKIIDLICKE